MRLLRSVVVVLLFSAVSCGCSSPRQEMDRLIESELKKREKLPLEYPDLKRLCELSDPWRCHRQALLYHSGKGVTRHFGVARRLYSIACRRGVGDACSNLAGMHRRGLGTKTDKTRAVEFYRKACGLHSMIGCENLGQMIWSGRGVSRNLQLGLTYLRKACYGGRRQSCPRLALQASLDCSKPRADKLCSGVDVLDYRRLRGVLKRGCKRKIWIACSVQGIYIDKGADFQRSLPESMRLLQLGCTNGDPYGCNALGRIFHLSLKNEPRALGFFKKACGRGFAPGCLGLAALYTTGTQIKQRPELAVGILKRLCRPKSTPSICQDLQRLCTRKKYAGCPLSP